MPEKDVPPIFREAGVTGLRRSSGYIQEEFLPQLTGYRAIQTYREMRDNDPVVGAILYAIDKLIRQVPWRVQPASVKNEDMREAKFLESCLHDMSHTWEDLISEILSMLAYGWSLHEIVYKIRRGPNDDNPITRSRFDDGRIGWRKIPIRAQETRQDWNFDEDGGIRGMYQNASPDYQLLYIPIEKSLLFRTTTLKNNPEGRSLLRNAYRPWYFKRRMEEIEAIGIERDLAGFPVMYVDPDIMRSDATALKQTIFSDYQDAIVNIRRDQQEGMILPSIYDDNGNQMYRIELLTAGGRQFDTSTVIQRYDSRIASTVLADFILLGQQAYGSYALSSDKTNLFALSLRTWLEAIKSVFNQHAIPRLFKVNGIKLDKLPELDYGEIETPPLTEIGTFIQQLAGAGAPLFPDNDLENHLRMMAKLPERREQAKGSMPDAMPVNQQPPPDPNKKPIGDTTKNPPRPPEQKAKE